MWILAIEAAVVLGLLIFIIWWTIPKKKDKDKKED
jgi:hypothetical protein